MKYIVLTAIGRTGDGKSCFLNSFIQKNIFETSSSPNSCTFLTTSGSNIVNNMERIAIDTQGLEDTDLKDNKNIQQMTSFLKNWDKGVNVVAIIINSQNPRITSGTVKLIKLMHQLFNHPDFFNHVCLVFTRCYKGIMTENDKSEMRNEYRKRVLDIIRECPGCKNSNPQIPVFFVDSNKWKEDSDTYDQLTALHSFAMSKDKLPTKQAKKVHSEYISITPEIRRHVLLRTEDSRDGMVRTYYYADQKRNKQKAYNGAISYTNWVNYNNTTETKRKKVSIEKKEKQEVDRKQEEVLRWEKYGGRIGIIFGPRRARQVHDHYKITIKYQDLQRKIITDFYGYKKYGDWEVINEYKETFNKY